MKFLAVFAALVAVAASQNTWTLSQLANAIESPHTDPALLPHLEQALNEMMENIFAGKPVEPVTVTIPAGAVTAPAADMAGWTLEEITAALENPETDPALIPALEHALNEMMEAIHAGAPIVTPVVVGSPAMEVTSWTLSQLDAALQDPTTNPELVPYLENALNEMMLAIASGTQMEAIVVAVPAGLTPVVPAPVEAPAPEEPFLPVAPVVTPAASSPLVQIIININNQQEDVAVSPVVVPEPVVVPSPPLIPSPVIIPSPVVLPEPIAIPSPVMIPEPVIIPSPVVLPEPIEVSPVIVEPPSASIPIGVVTPA